MKNDASPNSPSPDPGRRETYDNPAVAFTAAHIAVVDAIERLRSLTQGDRRLRLQVAELLLGFAKTEILLLRDLDEELAFSAARVLEAVDECFFGVGSGVPIRRRAREMFVCAAKLLRLVAGKYARSMLIPPSERSRLALHVREKVLEELERPEPHRDLAEVVDLARLVYRATSLFPRVRGSEDPEYAVTTFRRGIALNPRRSGETNREYATTVVTVCAKVAGLERPSSLFQFEDKAIKRAPRP